MTPHLKDEIKKRGPLQSLAQEAVLNLLRTSDRLQIRLARLFREFGLTSSQYSVLRILRGEGQPLPILEIAQRTITVVPGITGLIDRLEQAGHVARARCDRDRRVIYVSLTPQAVELLAKVDQPLEALHHELVQSLEPQQMRELIGMLEKLRGTLTDAG